MFGLGWGENVSTVTGPVLPCTYQTNASPTVYLSGFTTDDDNYSGTWWDSSTFSAQSSFFVSKGNDGTVRNVTVNPIGSGGPTDYVVSLNIGTDGQEYGCTAIDFHYFPNLTSIDISTKNTLEIYNLAIPTQVTFFQLAGNLSGPTYGTVEVLDLSVMSDLAILFLFALNLTSVKFPTPNDLTNVSWYFNSLSTITSIVLPENISNTGQAGITCNYCPDLASIRAVGYKGSNSGTSSRYYTSAFNNNNLDTAAINQLFTDLGTAAGSPGGNLIDVSGNPGSTTCNPTIATTKGWVVNT